MNRILFVDDESKVLDGIKRLFYADRKHWDMAFAQNAEDALKLCEAAPFDLVISDMRMPGMDGAKFLGIVRDRYPDAVRIVLSGYAETESTSRVIPVAHRFLNKPCDPATLRSTIERLCALRDLLSTPEIRRIIGVVSDLPSLSSTYRSLTQALRDPDVSMRKVAEILARDVAMSAKILQLVNSAFFGLGHKVTGLQEAATYLGLETLKNLALVTETFGVFKPSSSMSQAAFEAIQQHSYKTAEIIGLLPLDRKFRDDAIISGLLHDIGRVAMASKLPDMQRAVVAHAQEYHCRWFEAEEELLGTSHAEIGAYLLGLWGIPDATVQAVAHHHRPERISHSGLDASLAVYIADLLTHEENAHEQPSAGFRDQDMKYLDSLGLLPQLDEFRRLAADRLAPAR